MRTASLIFVFLLGLLPRTFAMTGSDVLLTYTCFKGDYERKLNIIQYWNKSPFPYGGEVLIGDDEFQIYYDHDCLTSSDGETHILFGCVAGRFAERAPAIPRDVRRVDCRGYFCSVDSGGGADDPDEVKNNYILPLLRQLHKAGWMCD